MTAKKLEKNCLKLKFIFQYENATFDPLRGFKFTAIQWGFVWTLNKYHISHMIRPMCTIAYNFEI
jgi:hypothetical protein